MKAGIFRIDSYLEKLNEEAESGGLKGAGTEGMLIPDENKKSFSWLKKEYDKSKVEVKVEIKMGGSKFEPGYEMQTNLKSVNNFKPGMFGDVKTSDSPDSKKEDKKVPDAEDSKGPKKQPDTKVEKAAEGSKAPEKSKEKPKNTIQAKVKTAEDTDEKKKKVEESWKVVREGKKLGKDEKTYLLNLPMTIQPLVENLIYVRKIRIDSLLESILESLPSVNFSSEEDLLEKGVPFNDFYIANIINESNNTIEESFLVDPAGHDSPRYIAELI